MIGTGSYLPEKVLTNADLEKMVDTSDEWILARTGIRERRIARDDETTAEMSAQAARRAIESAGIDPSDIDLIIVATATPDMPFPSTACFVQDMIGAKKVMCFDIEAACSGFLYALEVARQFVSNGSRQTVLVIGAEKLSCITDWEDRATCVLFGDGAGAVLLKGGNDGRGMIASTICADGSLAKLLNVPGGGSRHPASPATLEDRLHYIKMTGNEVFKHAVRCMCEAGQRVLGECGMTIDEVDLVVPHQANMRIIKAIASRLGNSIDKFYINVERVGNISGASVPVALDEAVREGRLKKGDIVLMIVFGGGFTWGAMLMEW